MKHRRLCTKYVSIHAPRVGSDTSAAANAAADSKFQSTLPAWGATERVVDTADQRVVFQSTLPAWGATGGTGLVRVRTVFQSTLPAWGATLDRG